MEVRDYKPPPPPPNTPPHFVSGMVFGFIIGCAVTGLLVYFWSTSP